MVLLCSWTARRTVDAGWRQWSWRGVGWAGDPFWVEPTNGPPGVSTASRRQTRSPPETCSSKMKETHRLDKYEGVARFLFGLTQRTDTSLMKAIHQNCTCTSDTCLMVNRICICIQSYLSGVHRHRRPCTWTRWFSRKSCIFFQFGSSRT